MKTTFKKICSVIVFSYSMTISHGSVPIVSIITSVYKGDKFIKGFLEDIVQQTIFDKCELIIINANSPGNEEPIINEYVKLYSNIIYQRLKKDPGLYAVWNMGIKLSRAEYIVNANIDDRLKYTCYEEFVAALDNDTTIDVVYSGAYETLKPNETFYNNSSKGKTIEHSCQDFNKKKLIIEGVPYPNNHPMWRKSLHAKYGLFDAQYKVVGDLEMWMRISMIGDAVIKRIPELHGLFYTNPNGLSSCPSSLNNKERKNLLALYKQLYKNLFRHIEFL